MRFEVKNPGFMTIKADDVEGKCFEPFGQQGNIVENDDYVVHRLPDTPKWPVYYIEPLTNYKIILCQEKAKE